ncbi:hypothetical protein B7R22_12690 [Subtercola boreus]|uniref:Phospholipase/carboxylesterase/thioesterase domain-containing protein n=2 Tax=Subtercola boreus TaxID=120213 RepID=A0A3E0VVR6_9MICO|nr:hypothetical protein B7R22_12690 [Subtercola boreus]
MHGYGSHENDLISLAPLLPEGTIAASLRAPLVAPQPIVDGFAWFTIGQPGNPQISGLDDAAASVLEWLDRVEAAYGTAPSITTLGFSQGGAMAVHLLRTAPARFAAAVNLSGFTVTGDAPGDQVLAVTRPPVFWGRDVADPIITAEAVARTEAWLPGHSTLTANLYPGILHGVSQEEIGDVTVFLQAALGLSDPDDAPASATATAPAPAAATEARG